MYRGIIAPLVTPLRKDDSVCEESLLRLLNHLRPDVAGLMPCLSSGEGWKLTPRQWVDMVSYCVDYSDGLPVIAGIELGTTRQVIERARQAQRLGVTGIIITTPFGKNVPQDEMFEHFRLIRDAVDLPIVIYNESALSNNETLPETLSRICELPGIIGIKESSGSIEVARQLLKFRLEGVPLFQGWENLLLRSTGLDGYVISLTNLEPRLCAEMFRNPMPETQKRIDDLCEPYGLFTANWYYSIKIELKKRGILKTDRIVS